MEWIIILALLVTLIIIWDKYRYYRYLWENARPEMWESGEDRFD